MARLHAAAPGARTPERPSFLVEPAALRREQSPSFQTPTAAELAAAQRGVDRRLLTLRRYADSLQAWAAAEVPGEGARPAWGAKSQRGTYVGAMRRLHAQLQELAAAVARAGAAVEGGRGGRPPPDDEKAPRAPPQALGPAQLVPVTGSLALPAVVLPPALRGAREVFAAVAPGGLFFVPAWGHFAVRLGDCVFHAAPGRIFPPASRPRLGEEARRAPARVKDCHRCPPERPRAGCHYYHDPERFAAEEARNFVADSWLYAGGGGGGGPPGRRRFGSVEAMEADLLTLGEDDARRFLAQTAHDLVCALVLWRYILGGRAPAT